MCVASKPDAQLSVRRDIIYGSLFPMQKDDYYKTFNSNDCHTLSYRTNINQLNHTSIKDISGQRVLGGIDLGNIHQFRGSEKF